MTVSGPCPRQVTPGPPGRQRRQTGSTNRWRLDRPPAGDLLGQAQAQRAVSLSHRTTRSAGTLRMHDVPFSQDAPLTPAAKDRPTGLCHRSGVHSSPEHSFYSLTQEVTQNAKPDAVLECLGSIWELHCPFLSRSGTLAKLYTSCKKQRTVLLQSRAASGTGSGTSSRWCSSTGRWGQILREEGGLGLSRGSLRRPALLHLPVHDPSITKEVLSFALRTLYRPAECPECWEGAVLSVAALLDLPQLYQRCLNEMMSCISSSTACDFHRVSCQHKQTALQSVCERWLELFLVTDLSCQIDLRDLPYDLLLKTLRSPRVFAVSEYDLLTTVLKWIYLQLNTTERTLPSHSAVTSFFCRAPRVFLEQPLGHFYIALFQALHLHGINGRQNVEEIQKLNIFPDSWLLLTFSSHYNSIHRGGNMHVTDFSKQSVRFGMIINGELQQCTQAIGLYGFYFLLKASRAGQTDAFDFSMERLRHWDPALPESCRTTQPFSVRSERCVWYQVRVQSLVKGWQETCSGVISRVFSLNKRNSRSQVFTVDGLSTPFFVTFALAFPSSG